jgi:hypothetical protein
MLIADVGHDLLLNTLVDGFSKFTLAQRAGSLARWGCPPAGFLGYHRWGGLVRQGGELGARLVHWLVGNSIHVEEGRRATQHLTRLDLASSELVNPLLRGQLLVGGLAKAPLLLLHDHGGGDIFLHTPLEVVLKINETPVHDIQGVGSYGCRILMILCPGHALCAAMQVRLKYTGFGGEFREAGEEDLNTRRGQSSPLT